MDNSQEQKDLISNHPSPLELETQEENIATSPLSPEEKRNLYVLTLLYTIQGIAIGFFYVAVPILLAEKGATYKDLSVFSMILYPFSFKIIFAPLLDTYYSNSFGKRKSYIVPLQYILAGLLYVSSYYIQSWLDEQNIWWLTATGFLNILIAATQDIAVDGLVLTMLTDQHVGLGSNCQSAGQITGMVVSSSLFIQFSSHTFCQEYLGVQQILTYQTFLQILAIFTLLVTVYLHLLVSEQIQTQQQIRQQQSISQLIKSLKGFLTNPNLFKYLLLLLFWRTGFSPVESSSSVMLLQKGFTKESMTLVSTVMTPVSLLVPLVLSKYYKPNQEITIWSYIILAKLIDYLSTYLLVIYYTPTPVFTLLFFLSSFYSTLYQSIGFINMGSFNNRISDLQGGGTFLTFLASAGNLGGMWGPSLSLYLLSYIQYHYLVIMGLIYTLAFYRFYFRTLYSLETLNKSAFTLNHKTQ